MQRLLDLQPRFIKYQLGTSSRSDSQWGPHPVDEIVTVNTICDADGLSFRCPKCDREGYIHILQLWFRHREVPDHMGQNSKGEPSRWGVIGQDFFDISLDLNIQVHEGCRWLGKISHGMICNVDHKSQS